MTLRTPKAEIPDELREAMLAQLGVVPTPFEALWNHPQLAEANQQFTAKLAACDAVDESLKTFAHMAVAARVGCGWCLDINYFQAQNQNLAIKASQVPRWRESQAFTPLERDVLEYAEAMTDTPPTVTENLFARVLEQLGPQGMVELTVFVGFANLATRCNVAQGIEPQGFSAACEIPLALPSESNRRSAVS